MAPAKKRAVTAVSALDPVGNGTTTTDFELLKEQYLHTMRGFGAGHYWSFSRDRMVQCDDGDLPCAPVDFDEFEQTIHENVERGAWLARFFLKVAKWAVRRVKKRVWKNLVRAQLEEQPDYKAPALEKTEFMICVSKDGTRGIRLGRTDGNGHAHYPKALEHIFGNVQGSRTHHAAGAHGSAHTS